MNLFLLRVPFCSFCSFSFFPHAAGSFEYEDNHSGLCSTEVLFLLFLFLYLFWGMHHRCFVFMIC